MGVGLVMKNKKIGLLTFHDNTNYGSWLQTYGLYKTIKDMGYEIEVVDFWKEKYSYSEIITIEGLREIWRKQIDYKAFFLYNLARMQMRFSCDKKKYMRLSKHRYTRKNVGDLNKEYDVFLIGSDLVWDVRYAQDCTYMLDFAKKAKIRIAYAASYGYEQIPKEEEKYFRQHLSKFRTITVRENNAKDELEQLLKVPIEHVCDPTMLLENVEWKKFIKKNCREKKYVLVYMPDEKIEILKVARSYARKHHYQVLTISKTKGSGNVCPYGVEEFLSLFYWAEKIFTGSYHGIMVSVYFEKEFVYRNRKPINRMKSVVDVLGFEKQELTHPEFDIEKPIDYESVKLREKQFRKKSRKILEEMLADAHKIK